MAQVVAIWRRPCYAIQQPSAISIPAGGSRCLAEELPAELPAELTPELAAELAARLAAELAAERCYAGL